MDAAGGLNTLYAGIRPTLIRAFPANAAQWLAWECAMRYALLHQSTYICYCLILFFHSLNPGMLKAQQLVSCHLCWSPGVVVQLLIHDPDGDALLGRLHSFPTPCRAYHKAERENLDR